MSGRRTPFDEFFDEQMRDPAVASAYAEARAEVDQVDQFMRALEAARTASGLSKAELARLSKMPAEGVRRVLSSEGANPTLGTVLSMLRTMGLRLQIVRTEKARGSKGREGLASGALGGASGPEQSWFANRAPRAQRPRAGEGRCPLRLVASFSGSWRRPATLSVARSLFRGGPPIRSCRTRGLCSCAPGRPPAGERAGGSGA